MRINEIKISEHFMLYEFEDRADGNVVVLHPMQVIRLEELHLACSESLGREVAVYITCGTRTQASNRKLAGLLGWTDQGGLVSRTSKHLPKFGGIASDLHVVDKEFGQLMPTLKVADLARPLFDVVIDHYPTHIHVDLRNSSKPYSPDAETSETTP
ncbi:hypothetical protein LCGC14_0906940 [marine sediment metagenome]|uniref:Peptidase M15A C-terminal domain-containing protein n=1 Tax=marine sediment metagenome TaxID=412755 RepID=A0A0F9NZF5_9ZZZZ